MIRPLALSLLLVLGGSAASAGEITVFAGMPSPGESWGRVLGGTFSTTWFQVLALEGEYARASGEVKGDDMKSLTGAALVAPSIGVITPFAGLAIGVHRQTAGDLSDNGVLRAFVVGAKLKLGLAVVRAEYRQINLGDEPLVPMDRRLSLGAGIRF